MEIDTHISQALSLTAGLPTWDIGRRILGWLVGNQSILPRMLYLRESAMLVLL